MGMHADFSLLHFIKAPSVRHKWPRGGGLRGPRPCQLSEGPQMAFFPNEDNFL